MFWLKATFKNGYYNEIHTYYHRNRGGDDFAELTRCVKEKTKSWLEIEVRKTVLVLGVPGVLIRTIQSDSIFRKFMLFPNIASSITELEVYIDTA